MQPPFGIDIILFDFSLLGNMQAGNQRCQYQKALCVSLSNKSVIGYFT